MQFRCFGRAVLEVGAVCGGPPWLVGSRHACCYRYFVLAGLCGGVQLVGGLLTVASLTSNCWHMREMVQQSRFTANAASQEPPSKMISNTHRETETKNKKQKQKHEKLDYALFQIPIPAHSAIQRRHPVGRILCRIASLKYISRP